MYYTRLFYHLMWTTKDLKPHLKGHEGRMGRFIMSYAEKKSIDCRLISVLPDHVHCLVRLNPTQSISDAVQLLKGRSSVWMNEDRSPANKFRWEDEYFAFSLGYSQVKVFEEYLENQWVYHSTHSVKKEIQEISKKYNFSYS